MLFILLGETGDLLCTPVIRDVLTPGKIFYLSLLPTGEVDVVAEEVDHVPLGHLGLQRLQQVCEPLKGLCLRAQPVEVDLNRGEIDAEVMLIISSKSNSK